MLSLSRSEIVTSDGVPTTMVDNRHQMRTMINSASSDDENTPVAQVQPLTKRDQERYRITLEIEEATADQTEQASPRYDLSTNLSTITDQKEYEQPDQNEHEQLSD